MFVNKKRLEDLVEKGEPSRQKFAKGRREKPNTAVCFAATAKNGHGRVLFYKQATPSSPSRHETGATGGTAATGDPSTHPRRGRFHPRLRAQAGE